MSIVSCKCKPLILPKKEPFACIKRDGMDHTATINVTTMRNNPNIPCDHTPVVQPTAWSQILTVQNITKTGATVSVSHSCGLLLYDSAVHKDTKLEGAHNIQPDTVKPTCQNKVQMYVENALAKVKISL